MIRLKNMRDVRLEMSRVYSEARRKALAAETASKFIYMLTQIGRVIEGSEFEKRIAELERRMAREAGQ